VWADVPQHLTLNVQVFDTDDLFGYSFQGPVIVELFDAAEGGNALWGEVHEEAEIEFGFLSLPLGKVNADVPLAAVLADNSEVPLYLEVTLGNEGEVLPQRIEFTSVPFSLACSVADVAHKLGNKTAGDFALTEHQHTIAQFDDWPMEFEPTAHTHSWLDLTSEVPTGFTPEYHEHPWEEVSGKPEEFPPAVHNHEVVWEDISGIPEEFSPAVHNHEVVWEDISGIPEEFPAALHEHDQAYLAADGKAQDAELLDGLDGAEFALTAELLGVQGQFDEYYTSQELDGGQLDERYYTKQECEQLFATAADTYTKEEVDQAITTAVATAVGPIEARLWCLENCSPAKLQDCYSRECDGMEETCLVGDKLPEGTVCQAETGIGSCQNGVCLQMVPTVCGGTICPDLAGYEVACNDQQHCEYAVKNANGWEEWDVWIYIAPGQFEMGSTGEGGGSNEAPVHTVTIDYGYLISKYPIMVPQHEACVGDQPGGCSSPSTGDWDPSGWGVNTSANGRADHPQNGLKWQQARDFCEWVAPGGRLPSEAEWEYAASGPVHRKYPWGDTPEATCSGDMVVFNETGDVAGYGCGVGGTWPAGAKTAGASWCGAVDMGGNVWEWNEDLYHDGYVGAPDDGSPWLDVPGTSRIMKGGSYSYNAVHTRCAERGNASPFNRFADLGSRCARTLP